VTGVAALVAIIALAAGGLIVVFLAIAHVERIEDTGPPEPSAPRPPHQVTIQTGGVMPSAQADAPSPRARAGARTAVEQKPPRRTAWHGVRHAWKVWRYRHADELRGRAGWVALVVSSAVLAYLIAHL
jgi:hypothetical protein